jgi:hypothetical protein
MSEPINFTDNGSFLRAWAERVYDDTQLAFIAAIQQCLVDFAMTAWRPAGQIEPPLRVPLICACEEGIVIMSQTEPGEWRTSTGTPHKPPRAWMPCPFPPPL